MNNIKHKITDNLPLTFEELMILYDSNLDTLQKLAEEKRRILNGNKVFYNQNFHIEPSNICMHRCRFCSYRR
ncbi:MAG: aminofutalosine synthase MqnE, partial [Bacteroidales bacterium]